ncbi:MAG: TlpA disulfide reductase family protein [Bdellovibrionota bacterium]|nr:TlpA disulfide reductase family protein [Bdellovibrionota bacterium]
MKALIFSLFMFTPSVFATTKLNLAPLGHKVERKTVVNFWATWCTACIQEIAELEALKKKYPKVDFVAVNAGESKKKIARFVKKHGFTYKILRDKDKSFSKGIGVLSLPQTFVVDETGKVLYHESTPPKKI